MARINVDESWFSKDQRRKDFIKLVGDEEKADGLALKFWLLGQEAYAKGKLVNKKMFTRIPFAKEFIACELAEERKEGIYVKGSKRSEWYKKMIDGARKGGSQKSTAKAQAALEREKNKRLVKNQVSENTSENTRLDHKKAQTTSPHNIHTHSHTHSHVQDNSQIQEELNIGADAPHPTGVGNHKLPKLILVWNEHCGKLPKVKSTSPSRDKKIAACMKLQSIEEWAETFKKMAESKFLNGKSVSLWRASFDWILKADNWLKVNEGHYDNNKGAIQTAHSLKYDKLDEVEQYWKDKEKRT